MSSMALFVNWHAEKQSSSPCIESKGVAMAISWFWLYTFFL